MEKPLNHYDREKIIWECLLPANEKFTLLALNSFVDGNGSCWPGQKTLASMTGLTERTIRSMCSSLESKGVLEIVSRYKEGKRTSNIYKVDFPAIVASFLPEPPSGRKPLPEGGSGKQGETGSARLALQPEGVSGDLSSPDLDLSINELTTLESQVVLDLGIPQSEKVTEASLRKEFDDEFWPLAYKQVGEAKSREAYVKARRGNKKQGIRPIDKTELLRAWEIVNKIIWPKKNEEDRIAAEKKGDVYQDKKYIPLPTTWLNQGRWSDEAILKVIRNGGVASVEVKAEESRSLNFEIRSQHARLNQPGSQIIPGSGFTRQGVTTIWDILERPSEATEYLKWLRSQEPEEDEHPMAI